MAKFTFTGDVEMAFPTLTNADGSTLVAKPGDVVELATDPQSAFLSPVASSAKSAPSAAPEAPEAAPTASDVSTPTTN